MEFEHVLYVPRWRWTTTQKLYAMILADQLDILYGTRVLGSGSYGREQRRTRHWLESRAAGEGSFCYLCEALNLEPDYVRRLALKDGRKRKVHNYTEIVRNIIFDL